jgi:hypothetical protein
VAGPVHLGAPSISAPAASAVQRRPVAPTNDYCSIVSNLAFAFRRFFVNSRL